MTAYRDAALFATPPFDRLVPARTGYQGAPISEAFNWSYTLEDIEEGSWHLIVFRSQRSAAVDNGLLTDHDDLAFAEAMSSGGLLRYYKGSLDRQGRCLSLCVWESVDHARVATDLPEHRAAAALTAQFYDSYEVERYVLTKLRDQDDPVITFVSGVSNAEVANASARALIVSPRERPVLNLAAAPDEALEGRADGGSPEELTSPR